MLMEFNEDLSRVVLKTETSFFESDPNIESMDFNLS